MNEPKTAKASLTVMTELVLPNDTNVLFNLRGGKLLHWMDIAAAIAAQKHSNCTVVTASVDNVSFENPIKLGNVVTIQAKVTRAFTTSMETFIEVWAENLQEGTKIKANEAYYTFVALDKKVGKPVKVCSLIPETAEEKDKFDKAKRRRELRLVLAGKIKPEDAPELKAIFNV